MQLFSIMSIKINMQLAADVVLEAVILKANNRILNEIFKYILKHLLSFSMDLSEYDLKDFLKQR